MLSKRFSLAVLVAGAVVIVAQAQKVEARNVAQPAKTQLTSLKTLNPGDCCTPVCCPTPCITYRHRGPKLCCNCCLPPVETILKVKNPCTGCETDVTVCLPGCCTGEPKVCCGSGIFGRDVIEYTWCCGFSTRVAFKRTGDLLVTTWGR